MSYVEDTQIRNGTYKPGTLLDDGKWRVEFDSMGQVKVPAERLWGAQTQRSLIHFSIGHDRMPIEVYHAYGFVKKAAAIVNERLGHLAKDKADLIVSSAEEVIAGKLDENFPSYVQEHIVDYLNQFKNGSLIGAVADQKAPMAAPEPIKNQKLEPAGSACGAA